MELPNSVVFHLVPHLEECWPCVTYHELKCEFNFLGTSWNIFCSFYCYWFECLNFELAIRGRSRANVMSPCFSTAIIMRPKMCFFCCSHHQTPTYIVCVQHECWWWWWWWWRSGYIIFVLCIGMHPRLPPICVAFWIYTTTVLSFFQGVHKTCSYSTLCSECCIS